MAGREVDRRGFLKKSLGASAGVTLGMGRFEEQNLLAKMGQSSTKKALSRLPKAGE